MNVLIACEFSGIVREAFRKRGHNAWSCDLLPSEIEGQHMMGDAIMTASHGDWDLMIAHPPCTYISNSGLHWNCRTPGRHILTRQGIEFVEKLWGMLRIPHVAIENPIGCLATHSSLMKATQTIQPYNFGEDASKDTCLWLRSLPPLVKTKYVEPRIVDGKPRWSNQTDSGQNKLGPSETRAMDRAKTYQGIADAMAEQWGGIWT